MYKLLVGNEKGGVGKTTLATHIAAGLACRGWRVMLVDADEQGHATMMFGLPKAPGLYNLLVRDAGFNDVVRLVPPEQYGIPGERIPQGKLYVVPSNVETRNIANSISDLALVGQRLEELEGQVDVVVIDTSPTPSLLHGTFYIATDGVLYPTQAEVLGFDGLAEAWKHRQQAETTRELYGLPPIHVAGIVPTMYRGQTVEHQRNLELLQQQFGGLVWNPVAERIIWTESAKYHRPVYALNPLHPAAGDAWEMVDRVERVVKDSKTVKAAG